MAMMKRLVVVVECSRLLIISWRAILRDCIGKVVRSFCGNEATNPAVLAMVELIPPHPTLDAAASIESSIWTADVELFLEWLETLEFIDNEFPDVPIAQGLRETLRIFPAPNGEEFENHCILVVATETDLTDAETVAESFPQSFVSLSVVCPTQLTGLEEIYDAGKNDVLAADHTMNIVNKPHSMVLISDNLKEACADITIFDSFF